LIAYVRELCQVSHSWMIHEISLRPIHLGYPQIVLILCLRELLVGRWCKECRRSPDQQADEGNNTKKVTPNIYCLVMKHKKRFANLFLSVKVDPVPSENILVINEEWWSQK
jgi:hypothetical protein